MILRASDTISGKEGKATANINGTVHDLFYLKDLEADIEKAKEEVKAMGERGTQHKTVGWSGSGSFTIHYMTSIFRKMVLEYVKTGKDTYFDITVTNDDPSSTVGIQTILLIDCNLDGISLAKLDSDDTILEEDVEFTFTDVELVESFTSPIV